MKFNVLFCLLLLSAPAIHAQPFEGKIVYENAYRSKVPNVSDEQFNTMMGTTQEYLIKGGNYKSVMGGSMFQWQLYRNDENKLYMKMSNAPAVFWKDGSENPDEVQKAEMNKGVVTIQGHLCDALILTCKSGVQKYYFSPKLKVDPSLYSGHKFGNFSEYISRTRSLPLKIIIETPQFTMESVATEIIPMKLADSEFELPPDTPVQKSPY